jgi:alkylation response protein AidB-like acyl-CoA dehydrogenase
VLLNQPSEDVPDGARWYNRVVSSRQYTIAGGTSEIQRNIIGERVLGLPKD